MGFDYAPPKYAQVVAEIKSRIERGEYPPGSLLPSEHQLVSDFGVSRPTIVKVTNQMGHTKIETTKNIYGHLFAEDRAFILKAMNQAVSRLYVQEDPGEQAA